MITDRFTCSSANVIYCITCTLCNRLYIGETGRRLGDRFRDVEKNDKDASKPVARHFNFHTTPAAFSANSKSKITALLLVNNTRATFQPIN